MQLTKYIKGGIAIVLTLLCVNAFSQTNVTGKVTDAEDGSGLPGVNIQIKGTTSGTVTDFNGNYSISVDANATLVFSFVGYASQEVVVGNQSTIDVALGVDVTQLSEIVVVGYGEQEESDVTGVVTAVDASEFNKGAIISPDQLITGKVAGVNIVQNSGEPGGQSSIRIRGGTSITASNEPLYVIDGVPIDNAAHDPGGQPSGRNPLNFLNPNDIESFTVLKDASAAAIYGSRGANGVIIITTKKGKSGAKGSITYDTWYSVANAIEKVDVFDGNEFRGIVNRVAPNRNELLLNASTDWQAQVLQTAVGQNHALSFTGGAENIGYRLSVGYLDQEGIVKTSESKRLSMGLNLNTDYFDGDLKVNVNVKGSRTEDTFVPGGTVGNSVSFAPSQPIFDANSPWGGYWEWENPLGVKNPISELDQTEQDGELFRSIGNIELEYAIPLLEGLSAKVNLGYDVQRGERTLFLPSTLRSQVSDSGNVRVENMTRLSQLMEIYATYKRDLESINSTFDVTAGYSYQVFDSKFPGYRGFALSSDLFGVANPNPATEFEISNSVLRNKLISFFGRVNYSLKDRYLLTVNVRRDGSTRFGPDNQWGIFPSVALGWRISDEEFFSGLTNVFSNLKLRAGWGVTGNQDIPDYRYLTTYTFSDAQARVQFGDRFLNTIRANGADPGIKWEESKQLNIGLDFGFLAGRLTGSLEYYQKNTDDLLFEVNVPALSTTTNRVLTNIGSVENSGFELVLNSTVVDKGDLRVDLGFNVAYNDNEVTGLFGSNDPNFRGIETGGIAGGTGNNIQIIREGIPVNSFLVYKHKIGPDGKPVPDAVLNDDGTLTPNDIADLYEDTNNDGSVNDLDRVPFEDPAADILYGLTSQIYFKGFDLSFTLRGALNNYVYNNVASQYGNYSRVRDDLVPGNMTRDVLTNEFFEPQLFSDVYIEDASFLRMDNITLGYNVPKLPDFLNLRLYATVQNAFVITDYSGLDPEAGISGIDNNLYPRSRTFIFGLNLGL